MEKLLFQVQKNGGGNLKNKSKNCFSGGASVAHSAFFLEIGSSFVVEMSQISFNYFNQTTTPVVVWFLC